MRYLVILDANSPVGKMYAEHQPAYMTTVGSVRHPVLECTEVDLSNHWYIFAKNSLAREGRTYQSIYLPHNSVIQIIRYEETEGTPFGFLPSNPASKA